MFSICVLIILYVFKVISIFKQIRKIRWAKIRLILWWLYANSVKQISIDNICMSINWSVSEDKMVNRLDHLGDTYDLHVSWLIIKIKTINEWIIIHLWHYGWWYITMLPLKGTVTFEYSNAVVRKQLRTSLLTIKKDKPTLVKSCSIILALDQLPMIKHIQTLSSKHHQTPRLDGVFACYDHKGRAAITTLMAVSLRNKKRLVHQTV